jgi:hypothetical protein
MRRTLIVLALAAALVVAGCAGPGGEGVNETNETGNDTGLGGNDTGGNMSNATAGGDAGSVTNAVAGNEVHAPVGI